jgi:DNA-binding protein H-NS
MAQTYDEIQQQIERLQQKAQALRSTEVREVVDKIKVAIAHYELTAEQLGFGVGKRVAGKRAASPAVAQKPGASKTTKAQFSDAQGNVWGGRGPRPAWLRKALETGRDINEFRVGRRAKPTKLAAGPGAVAATTAVASDAPTPSKKKPARVAKVRYSDDAGHAWSGMGPKPAWLKAAIESGRSLADFAK